MARPLIGITAYTRYAEVTGWKYDVCYAANAEAIYQAGGLPILIPAGLDESALKEIYNRLDGILLPGGGDISPDSYGANPHPALVEVDAHRDFAELSMARWSMDDDRPLLGICRGIQILNVARGGTLTADIPSMLDTTLKHDIPRSQPRSTLSHSIDFEIDTRMAEIFGVQRIMVNSLHHQSILTVPEDAKITAYSPDGLVEGIEFPHKNFAMAVQWHPEDLLGDDHTRRLFKAFVDAAQANMRD